MAKQKKVTINDVEYTLQSVSPTWYFDINDSCGITGGKRKTAEYIDKLIRNVVISPKEISTEGMKYFDNMEDISTPEELLTAIESFLRERG